eukprot:Partr_v1_DN26685_c1_g1_i1_m69004 putative Guanine nucleotide binding protein (G protein) alpha
MPRLFFIPQRFRRYRRDSPKDIDGNIKKSTTGDYSVTVQRSPSSPHIPDPVPLSSIDKLKSTMTSSGSVTKTRRISSERQNSNTSGSGTSSGEEETIDGPVPLTISDPRDRVRDLQKEVIMRRATVDDDFESVKIIILGPCNAGKSTFVKQLRNVYLDGPSPQEVETFRHLILNNTLQSIKAVLAAMKRLNIPFADPVHAATRDRFLQFYDSNSIYVGEDEDGVIIRSFERMHQDAGFQLALSRGIEYQLIDSAAYLMNNVSRIFAAEYDPSTEDILMSRASTTNVANQVIRVANSLPIKIQDFGGYRFQRLKWYSYFTATIDACVYVHSLTSYDLRVEEDTNLGKLQESVAVFEEIVNHDVISNLPLILLLNKNDLFVEKLKKVSFRQNWPEYTGPEDPTQVLEYIKQLFLARIKSENSQRPVYVYTTTALNERQSGAIFKKVVQIATDNHYRKMEAAQCATV